MSDHRLTNKVLCVGLVASIVLPLGRIVLPFVPPGLDGIAFGAAETAVSTTLGLGLYLALFG